jgi:uncharacterized protein (DUF433 family)
MDYSKIITIDPGKRSGRPSIRDLRITVYDVPDYLAGGMTEAQILEDFPRPARVGHSSCLAFAAGRERKFEILSACGLRPRFWLPALPFDLG